MNDKNIYLIQEIQHGFDYRKYKDSYLLVHNPIQASYITKNGDPEQIKISNKKRFGFLLECFFEILPEYQLDKPLQYPMYNSLFDQIRETIKSEKFILNDEINIFKEKILPYLDKNVSPEKNTLNPLEAKRIESEIPLLIELINDKNRRRQYQTLIKKHTHEEEEEEEEENKIEQSQKNISIIEKKIQKYNLDIEGSIKKLEQLTQSKQPAIGSISKKYNKNNHEIIMSYIKKSEDEKKQKIKIEKDLASLENKIKINETQIKNNNEKINTLLGIKKEDEINIKELLTRLNEERQMKIMHQNHFWKLGEKNIREIYKNEKKIAQHAKERSDADSAIDKCDLKITELEKKIKGIKEKNYGGIEKEIKETEETTGNLKREIKEFSSEIDQNKFSLNKIRTSDVWKILEDPLFIKTLTMSEFFFVESLLDNIENKNNEIIKNREATAFLAKQAEESKINIKKNKDKIKVDEENINFNIKKNSNTLSMIIGSDTVNLLSLIEDTIDCLSNINEASSSLKDNINKKELEKERKIEHEEKIKICDKEIAQLKIKLNTLKTSPIDEAIEKLKNKASIMETIGHLEKIESIKIKETDFSESIMYNLNIEKDKKEDIAKFIGRDIIDLLIEKDQSPKKIKETIENIDSAFLELEKHIDHNYLSPKIILLSDKFLKLTEKPCLNSNKSFQLTEEEQEKLKKEITSVFNEINDEISNFFLEDNRELPKDILNSIDFKNPTKNHKKIIGEIITPRILKLISSSIYCKNNPSVFGKKIAKNTFTEHVFLSLYKNKTIPLSLEAQTLETLHQNLLEHSENESNSSIRKELESLLEEVTYELKNNKIAYISNDNKNVIDTIYTEYTESLKEKYEILISKKNSINKIQKSIFKHDGSIKEILAGMELIQKESSILFKDLGMDPDTRDRIVLLKEDYKKSISLSKKETASVKELTDILDSLKDIDEKLKEEDLYLKNFAGNITAIQKEVSSLDFSTIEENHEIKSALIEIFKEALKNGAKGKFKLSNMTQLLHSFLFEIDGNIKQKILESIGETEIPKEHKELMHHFIRHGYASFVLHEIYDECQLEKGTEDALRISKSLIGTLSPEVQKLEEWRKKLIFSIQSPLDKKIKKELTRQLLHANSLIEKSKNIFYPVSKEILSNFEKNIELIDENISLAFEIGACNERLNGIKGNLIQEKDMADISNKKIPLWKRLYIIKSLEAECNASNSNGLSAEFLLKSFEKEIKEVDTLRSNLIKLDQKSKTMTYLPKELLSLIEKETIHIKGLCEIEDTIANKLWLYYEKNSLPELTANLKKSENQVSAYFIKHELDFFLEKKVNPELKNKILLSKNDIEKYISLGDFQDDKTISNIKATFDEIELQFQMGEKLNEMKISLSNSLSLDNIKNYRLKIEAYLKQIIEMKVSQKVIDSFLTQCSDLSLIADIRTCEVQCMHFKKQEKLTLLGSNPTITTNYSNTIKLLQDIRREIEASFNTGSIEKNNEKDQWNGRFEYLSKKMSSPEKSEGERIFKALENNLINFLNKSKFSSEWEKIKTIYEESLSDSALECFLEQSDSLLSDKIIPVLEAEKIFDFEGDDSESLIKARNLKKEIQNLQKILRPAEFDFNILCKKISDAANCNSQCTQELKILFEKNADAWKNIDTLKEFYQNANKILTFAYKSLYNKRGILSFATLEETTLDACIKTITRLEDNLKKSLQTKQSFKK